MRSNRGPTTKPKDVQGEGHYYVKDAQFSVMGIVDEAGQVVETYEYSAYGLMTIRDAAGNPVDASIVGNTVGYTGRTWDAETGLWHYRNRMYSPVLGRFLQRDPAGFVDGMNLYAYARNNPLRFVDPMGLKATANEILDSLLEMGLTPDQLKDMLGVVMNSDGLMSDAEKAKLQALYGMMDDVDRRGLEMDAEAAAERARAAAEVERQEALRLYDAKRQLAYMEEKQQGGLIDGVARSWDDKIEGYCDVMGAAAEAVSDYVEEIYYGVPSPSEEEKQAHGTTLSAELGLESGDTRRTGTDSTFAVEEGMSVSGHFGGAGGSVGVNVAYSDVDVPIDRWGMTFTFMGSFEGVDFSVEVDANTTITNPTQGIPQLGGSSEVLKVGGNATVPVLGPQPLVQPQVQASGGKVWGEGYSGVQVSAGGGLGIPTLSLDVEAGAGTTYAFTAGDVASWVFRTAVQMYAGD